MFENNLLANYVSSSQSSYSGQSVGLTPVEADIELWRRIILNTPWIWKSKGTRKTIEFLLKFIGAPKGLIQFNEYVYKADGPIDVDLLASVLTLNGLETDISIYPIDSDGYPRPLPDTEDMYFQNNGLWYRETGGTGATIDILAGNNPHVGPYDGGSKYINQFTCLIPNFQPVTISSETKTTNVDNLYINYDYGSFNSGVTTATTVTTVNMTNGDGSDLDECIVFTPSIILDPVPTPILDECGCDTGKIDYALSLCVSEIEVEPEPCDVFVKPQTLDETTGWYNFLYEQYNQDGSVYMENGVVIGRESKYTSIDCCKNIGGNPFPYNDIQNGVVVDRGYVCCKPSSNGSPSTTERCGCTVTCKWMVQTNYITLPLFAQQGQQSNYLRFKDIDGSDHVVMPDGCNCVKNYTTPVPNITDPFNGQVGVACQLTELGIADLVNNGQNGQIYKFYKDKINGKINCYQNFTPNIAINTNINVR